MNLFKIDDSQKLKETMKKQSIPHVTFAIIDGETISSKKITLNNEMRIEEDSVLQACSLSKSLTAFAVLMLVNEGKIQLDLPVNAQLSTWKIPGNTTVTPRQCLSMTSGLSYGSTSAPITGYEKNDQLPTLQNILEGKSPAKNAGIQCINTPGVTCKYSGAGFMVLQKLIEDVTGKNFSDFMMQRILLPLEMNNSTFECPLKEKQKAIPGFEKSGKMILDGFENNPYSASGGLWSTPSDIAKFMLAFCDAYHGVNTTFISKELAHEMLTQQPNSDFALGMVVEGEGVEFNFRKTGHNNGYYCQLLMFPGQRKGAVVMTNSANGISLIQEIIMGIAQQYQWPPYSTNFDELNPRTTLKSKL